MSKALRNILFFTCVRIIKSLVSKLPYFVVLIPNHLFSFNDCQNNLYLQTSFWHVKYLAGFNIAGFTGSDNICSIPCDILNICPQRSRHLSVH